MADAAKTKLANATYRILLKAIAKNGWNCTQHDEDLTITFGVSGDDLSMDFVVMVDADRQLVRLMSRLPFKFPADRIMEGAIATSAANYSLADGCFDYDVTNGDVYFKMTTSYRASVISPEALRYLVNCAAYTVDKFNDQFLMVSNGAMTLKAFIEKFN